MNSSDEMRKEAQFKAARTEAFIRVSLRRWIRNAKSSKGTDAALKTNDQEKLSAMVKKLGGNAEAIIEKARAEIVDMMVMEMER